MTRTPHLELQNTRTDPASYLPSELVQEIFTQAGPASYSHDPPLSLVSRKWRSLALGTPKLWSMIYIRSVGWFATPRRLHTWLSRTFEHPLEIHLELRSELTTDNVFSVYKVLAPYLEQRVHRFHTYEEHNVLHIFGDFAARLPNVQKLAIEGYAESSPLPWRRRTVDLPTPQPGGVLRQMFNLEYLHLCLYPLRAMSAFNAPKLHTLKLECMTLEPQMLLELLRRSPRLKHLILRTIVWSRGIDKAEWPWREDDQSDIQPELTNIELTPINHSKTPINTEVSTRILQLSNHLMDLRIELSSLLDLSWAIHPLGVGSMKRLQITLDSNWSDRAKTLINDPLSASPGLGWLCAFNSLTELDLVFSHPTAKHSRKEDYDLAGFLHVLAGDTTQPPLVDHQNSPLPSSSRAATKSLPLPKLEHLKLILWDLDPNAVRSFLFCRAPDGPRFVARSTAAKGVGNSTSNSAGGTTPVAKGCLLSIICCSFSASSTSRELGNPYGGRSEASEPSLHHASYEEFQSFWFYLREKK